MGDCTGLRAELGKGKDLEARSDVRCRGRAWLLCSPHPAPQGDWTPLFCATFLGHTEAVLLLLAEGADMEAKDPVRRPRAPSPRPPAPDGTLSAPQSGATPLICAADKGRFEIAKVLLDRGAKVDAMNKAGAQLPTCRPPATHLTHRRGGLLSRALRRVAMRTWRGC